MNLCTAVSIVRNKYRLYAILRQSLQHYLPVPLLWLDNRATGDKARMEMSLRTLTSPLTAEQLTRQYGSDKQPRSIECFS